jgi:ElaB/YqjD/DUF883 family membrane-anchored ribosome-binding protein
VEIVAMTGKTAAGGGPDHQAELAALKEEMGRLAQAVRTLLEAHADQARARMGDAATEASSRAAAAAEHAKEAGQQLLGDAEKEAQRLAEELGGVIQRNPLGAAAGAFVVGLLLGLMRSR